MRRKALLLAMLVVWLTVPWAACGCGPSRTVEHDRQITTKGGQVIEGREHRRVTDE
jgi:hypothetical protein